jgi:hypothetical protein
MYKLLKKANGQKENKKTITLHGNPFQERHSKIESLPYWNGTAVGIDICLDYNTSFDAVLALIRSAYSQKIKERKKSKFKEAKFI